MSLFGQLRYHPVEGRTLVERKTDPLAEHADQPAHIGHERVEERIAAQQVREDEQSGAREFIGETAALFAQRRRALVVVDHCGITL
jgi:hypothetical protein